MVRTENPAARGPGHALDLHGLERGAGPQGPLELPPSERLSRDDPDRVTQVHIETRLGSQLDPCAADGTGQRLDVLELGELGEDRRREPSAARLLPGRFGIEEDDVHALSGQELSGAGASGPAPTMPTSM